MVLGVGLLGSYDCYLYCHFSQVTTTLGILKTIATSSGAHCKRHVPVLAGSLISAMGDSKVRYINTVDVISTLRSSVLRLEWQTDKQSNLLLKVAS